MESWFDERLLRVDSGHSAHAAPVLTHGPVLVTRVAPLPTLNIVETDGVQTMSSLDMVAYINATRAAGKAELAHKEFLRKVPSVLGETASAQFYAHVNLAIGNGATRQSPVYNFPRREAMLMAMSYSYKLQATVYDAWQEAEAKAAPAAPAPVVSLIPNFDDPIEAAEAWIASRKHATCTLH